MFAQKTLTALSKVKVSHPGVPPNDVQWVKDMRINPRTRHQLVEGLWKGRRGVTATVAYIASESDREKLRRGGKVMIHIIDLSSQKVTIIAPVSCFQPA